MSSRSGLVLMLSLMFGGSAALGVNKYVTNKSGVSLQPVDAVSVVVAAQDIPRGASITADMLKTREYPRRMLPPGTLAKVADALDRAVFVPLVKDELLLEGKLAPKGAKARHGRAGSEWVEGFHDPHAQRGLGRGGLRLARQQGGRAADDGRQARRCHDHVASEPGNPRRRSEDRRAGRQS